VGEERPPRRVDVPVVQLRGGGVSLVLGPPAPVRERGGGAGLPAVLHWGADLGAAVDPAALVAATTAAVPHSAPDVPVHRRVVPLPVDGWRLRPGLSGARPDGGAFSPCFAVESFGRDGSAETASLTASDAAAGLRVEVTWRLHPGGVLEVRQALTNTGDSPYQVASLTATLPLPAGATEVLDLTGRWGLERVPQRHRLVEGSWVRESRHGRTGHDAPTVVAAGMPGFGFRTGEVWAVHLGWSGDSSYVVERGPAGHAQVGAGELLAPGEVTLAPGETYQAPPLYAVHSGGGLDGVAAAFHRLLRARPQHPRGPRPVVLNTWEAVYFDHHLDRLARLADVAAAIGVERFVLDDGWFGDRRDDMAGLGDWYVSPDAWPDGLRPLTDHVRGLGMEFGLWVEPEMVNPDSALYREHPDWVLAVDGREPLPWRHQQLLDLAKPAVWEHILERLDALLTEHDIGFLKWDHNRDLIDAGHAGRAGVHAQTLAVYALLDELRRRHPGVEIESCASGGGRVDLGILARTDRVWASDTNDALDRQHVQRWTAQLVPPELVGAHVGAPRSHLTGRTQALSFRVATALFWHFGIEWDLTTASGAELSQLREAVAFHRRVRGLLHGGDVVRVDHPDPAAFVHGCVAPDRSAAVFAVVQLGSSVGEVPPPVRLAGLAPGAVYRVAPVTLAGGPLTREVRPPAWLAAGGVELPGRVLEQVGLQPPVLLPEQALLLELTRVD
jgi:alpha-galactosidase